MQEKKEEVLIELPQDEVKIDMGIGIEMQDLANTMANIQKLMLLFITFVSFSSLT